jgi:hypothetical protein
VALTKVKFWRVDDPVTKRLAAVKRLERLKLVAARLVAKKFVVVAEVPVAFKKVKF